MASEETQQKVNDLAMLMTTKMFELEANDVLSESVPKQRSVSFTSGAARQEQLAVKNVGQRDALSEENTYKQRKFKRRTSRTYGENPDCHFGPKAGLMPCAVEDEQVLTDPGTCRLGWQKHPLTTLVIKKPHDRDVNASFVELVTWLIEVQHLVVFVEENVLNECRIANTGLKNRLTTFSYEKDTLMDKIDFIICLGGDGTLLYVSSMFQKTVPPVMAFHLGSLGFLSPFTFEGFEEKVSKVLKGGVPLILRTRLKCTLLKQVSSVDSANASGVATPAISVQSQFGITKLSSFDREDSPLASGDGNYTKQHFLVLNEVVIDRGQSPFLSNIDLFIERRHITTVQGDGLIISTPTGSTAYAAAAGASMIHPNTPAILIAPICPHSLSFRPIVVPAGVELKIQVSEGTRGNAWLSFDGRNRQEMCRGDVLRVQTSIYPIPWVCGEDHIADWFQSLARCLQWNVRERQRSFSSSAYASSEESLHNHGHKRPTAAVENISEVDQ